MGKKNKKAWRKAVYEAMHTTAKKEALYRTKSNTPPFNYRWEHVCAVVTCALKLADLTGADKEIVEAAAWFHDVAKEARDDHPREGAKFARKFLPKTDFPPEKIEAVAQAIESHMGLWRDEPLTNLEAQVLWDADKLTKIGLTAAIQWTFGAIAADKRFTTERAIKDWQAQDWREKTVKSMHTEPARRAAQKRFEAYEQLVAGLSAEISASDIL